MMSHEETIKKEKIYFELVTRLGSEMLENGGEIFRTGDVMTYAMLWDLKILIPLSSPTESLHPC